MVSLPWPAGCPCSWRHAYALLICQLFQLPGCPLSYESQLRAQPSYESQLRAQPESQLRAHLNCVVEFAKFLSDSKALGRRSRSAVPIGPAT